MSDWDVLGLGPTSSPEEDGGEDDLMVDEFGMSQYNENEDLGKLDQIKPESPLVTESPINETTHKKERGNGRRKFGGAFRRDDQYRGNPGAYSYTERSFRDAIPSDIADDVFEKNHAKDGTVSPTSPSQKGAGRGRRASMNRPRDRRQQGGDRAPHFGDHVSHELLEPGKFNQEKYSKFRQNAIGERASLGIGKSAEMNSLYHFWCYYLRTNFNREMYDEFLKLARSDVEAGSHYGIECFFRMASYGLETNWDESVYHDFEQEAIADNTRGSTYGLEKVKAFLDNQKLGIEIPTSEEIKTLLAPYTTMDDFRQEAPKPITQAQQLQGRRGRRGRGWVALPPQGQSVPRPSAMIDVAASPDSVKQISMPPPGQSMPREVPPFPTPQPSQTANSSQNSGQGQKRQPDRRKQQQWGQRRRGGKNAPREAMDWSFGTRAQPCSAPSDSPMRKKFN